LKVRGASRGYRGSVEGDCSVRESSERLDHGRGGLEREEIIGELEFMAYKIKTKKRWTPTVAASPNQAPGALLGSRSLEQGKTEVGERNRAPVVARGSKGGSA